MSVSAAAGMAHIRAGLDEKRAFTKEAKLCCDRCKKQETSATPLQACSRCRSVRYCSRECQAAHYKTTHKQDCASFAVPPLCRAFNTTVCLPGCSYPETPVFARGISEGWTGDHSWGHGGRNKLDRDDPRTMLMMAPGYADGKYLSLQILVQNRSPKAKPMGKGIVAVASPRGTPIILEGKERENQPKLKCAGSGNVLGLAKTSAEITHFNGKSLADEKQVKGCAAVKDTEACAVLLNVGDHALELLQHVIIPCIPYDPKATAPYGKLLPEAADKDEVCEVRAMFDQAVVEAWYRDYKTKGERAYIASHYGEARAQMIGDGNKALEEMFKAMASMAGMNMGGR
ncbi:hypothetical protein K438DRAFT_1963259 [Mycena galopus ATCC 62051]|nr:hypothetical protein K438DRAFT_1963259 [Mycena galopus ATCC 62051]